MKNQEPPNYIATDAGKLVKVTIHPPHDLVRFDIVTVMRPQRWQLRALNAVSDDYSICQYWFPDALTSRSEVVYGCIVRIPTHMLTVFELKNETVTQVAFEFEPTPRIAAIRFNNYWFESVTAE